MKRLILVLFAALMLVSVLTACSGTASVEPYDGAYSNVSTTDNGRVNGTNGNGGMDYGSYSGTNRSYGNGSYGNSSYGTAGSSYGRTYSGTTSGTGMAGGR